MRGGEERGALNVLEFCWDGQQQQHQRAGSANHALENPSHQPPTPHTADPTQNTGTSLLETFDIGQLRSHVQTVRDEVVRAAAKNGATAAAAAAAYQDPKDICTVCKQSKFTFEPPCLYCTQCGQRIKRGQTYYCTPQVGVEGGRGRGRWVWQWSFGAAGQAVQQLHLMINNP